MRLGFAVCTFLFLSTAASPQDRKPPVAQPDQFEIGRHTFFDFGPPFDFYEIFVVRPTTNGTSIEKITLTPPGNVCVAPAKLETVSTSINQSVASLLGSTNPCTIPEKALRREAKRCKKCVVYSGANVEMQVRCGPETRIIRSEILDRDWFDQSPHTPENTTWTMGLLKHLDDVAGPGVMDKPVFSTGNEETANVIMNSAALSDLRVGKFDILFPGAPSKPSDLYQAAQSPPPPPHRAAR